MENHNVYSIPNHDNFDDPLTELLREGAKNLITAAVEHELSEFMEQFQGQKTANGLNAVVRSGYHRERDIQTGIGPVRVKIPKVRSNTGEPISFRSALVPPYVRKTRSLEAAIPWLYLKGVSTGEMHEALKVLLGDRAQGFSPSVVSRLKQAWEEQFVEWQQRDLNTRKWVYLWADGIYSGLRSEDVKLCSLVIIGVDEHGKKEFLSIVDGVRESTTSWHDMLLDLKRRGMNIPKLAVGDGAMGFWAALDKVYPETRHQRCWVHKSANVLNYLPKAIQQRAKTALKQIWLAETREAANTAFDDFIEVYQDKYPKAVQCLIKDRVQLMAFYDFPAKHWQSICTTNPIESTFATIRHRTMRAKGCLNRSGMLCMMFKLGQCAQENWRRLRGFKELGKVIEGVKFKDGVEVKEQTDQVAA